MITKCGGRRRRQIKASQLLSLLWGVVPAQQKQAAGHEDGRGYAEAQNDTDDGRAWLDDGVPTGRRNVTGKLQEQGENAWAEGVTEAN